MRWLTLAPLVAATGCNWVFGLEQTVFTDAPGSELPPSSRTALVWAIATTDGNLVAGVDPVLEYKAIGSETLRPKQPIIMVGDDNGLATATYKLDDGTFEIPFALRDSQHRVVYTLPDESIAHEVQWARTGAILVVPRTSRYEAPLAPTGSGYTITPMGLMPSTTLVAPALVTSGVFTYSNEGVDFMQSGSSITFRYAQEGMPVTQPFGAPQSGLGDWVLLTEWVGNGPTSNVAAYAKTQVDLVMGAMSMPTPEPAWTTTTRQLIAGCGGPDCLPSAQLNPAQNRLVAVFGGTTATRFLYGVSPSTDLPGFLPGVAPTFVERPLILPFVESNINVVSVTLADPSDGLGLERVVALRISSTRTVNGANLVSSIQAITNVLTSPLQFSAPLAVNVQFGSTNLSTPNDGEIITVGSGMQKLQFAPDTGNADDYTITLFELTGSALAPVRYYHVIAPEVKIDTSLLVSGRHYVFAITARTGLPGAASGDYGQAQYPFGSATTFTKTFIVQ